MRAEERVSSTIQTIRGDGFLRMIRDSNPTAFTRKRKVTAEWVTFGILNNRGLTQKMELRKVRLQLYLTQREEAKAISMVLRF